MGGYNSGGHNRKYDYTGRYKRLDSFNYGKYIPLLEQTGRESVESSISWTDGAEIGIDLAVDYLGVRYKAGGEEIRERIYFEAVPNNYGGNRLYFTCPYCGRRSRIMHLHQRHFKCRVCARLNYRSQQASKGWELAVYRLDKFLKVNFNITDLAPCDTELVTPPRPKGMHAQTYIKLIAELRTLQNNQMDAFISRVGSLGIFV